MNGICVRYIPRSTPFSKASLKTEYLSGGRLFGLKRTEKGIFPYFGLSAAGMSNIPLSASYAFLSAEGDLYLYGGGTVYRSTGARNNFFLYATGFSSAPSFTEICEKDGNYMLITDGVKAVRATSSTVQNETCPPVLFGVQHYSRMFGADKDDDLTLRWSAAGNARLWEESVDGAGYVRLNTARGGILRLIPYNNRLIAVRKNGLTSVRAYGDAEDFRVEVTDTDTDEILGGTAAVCAGKILFFTQSGLFSYDGDIERFDCEELSQFLPSGVAAACGNTYFASGVLGEEEVIACIDGESGDVCFISADADCLCAYGRAFCFSDGEVLEIIPQGDGGEWRWEGDFGSPSEKYLCSVCVDGAAEKLTVSSGGRVRAFDNVSGSVKVGMRGRKFEIVAECAEELRSVSASYALRG